jgi:ABC-2 type transport system permease protein
MDKVWLVARREFLFNLRRPGFLFGVFGVPLLTIGIWAVIALIFTEAETNLESVGQVGYVDQAGVLVDPLSLEDNPDLFIAYPDEERARAALDAEAIGAYFLLAENYLRTGNVELVAYGGTPEELQDRFVDFLRINLARGTDTDVATERLESPIDLRVRTEENGRVLTEASLPTLIFLPMIFAIVFMLSANITSGYLMGGIVEERTNRIMELLVTSLRPMQLLLGKVIGLGGLGLFQIVIWLGAGLMVISSGQSVPFLAGITFPIDMAVVFLLYFLISYFLLASLMSCVGVIANSDQESRQFAGYVSLVFVIPFFFFTALIEEPNGTASIMLSMIPLTAPISMLMRMGFTAVPVWQIALSLSILFVTMLVVVWVSARIFRWGLLLYGKRLTPRELWRAIRSKPEMATTAQEATAA